MKDLQKYVEQHGKKHGEVPPSLIKPVEISSML